MSTKNWNVSKMEFITAILRVTDSKISKYEFLHDF